MVGDAHPGGTAGRMIDSCHDVPDDIDVAEQRRIYHLIKMEARDHKQSGQSPSTSVVRSAVKRIVQSDHRTAGTQASILSLLSKK